MSSSVKDRLKADLEQQPQTQRRFRGWKGSILAQTEEFSIDIPIRYQKITSQTIDEAMNIITKSKTLGVDVKRKLLGEYHYGYVTDDGKEVSSDDVGYFQVIGGEERAVEQFEKSKAFEISQFVPKERMWHFLVEGFYEVWSEKNGLWLLADYLEKNQKLAVCSHIVLRKSFKEYYGLLYPVIHGDQYTLVMALTRMNLQYEHLRPAKPIAELPTVETAKVTPQSVLRVDLFGTDK